MTLRDNPFECDQRTCWLIEHNDETKPQVEDLGMVTCTKAENGIITHVNQLEGGDLFCDWGEWTDHW